MKNRYGFSVTNVPAEGVNTKDLLCSRTQQAPQRAEMAHELVIIRNWLKDQAVDTDSAVSVWISNQIDRINTQIGQMSN